MREGRELDGPNLGTAAPLDPRGAAPPLQERSPAEGYPAGHWGTEGWDEVLADRRILRPERDQPARTCASSRSPLLRTRRAGLRPDLGAERRGRAQPRRLRGRRRWRLSQGGGDPRGARRGIDLYRGRCDAGKAAPGLFRRRSRRRRRRGLAARLSGRAGARREDEGRRSGPPSPSDDGHAAPVPPISSVTTVKLSSLAGPKVQLIATSAASRPRAMSTRPIRGSLLRGSKVCHVPPR